MDDETLRFRCLNRRLALAATAAIALIALFVALSLLVLALGRLRAPETLMRLALTWSPSAFYLWALWTLRGLFAGLAREGPGLRPAVTTALSRIGWALVGGAVTTFIAAPLVAFIETHHQGGWFGTFNTPALTLCLLGLALVVLARMLRRAAHLETRVEALENVLESFI